MDHEKENLREASPRENCLNRVAPANSNTGHLEVSAIESSGGMDALTIAGHTRALEALRTMQSKGAGMLNNHVSRPALFQTGGRA